jgi:hypothetical protein
MMNQKKSTKEQEVAKSSEQVVNESSSERRRDLQTHCSAKESHFFLDWSYFLGQKKSQAKKPDIQQPSFHT